MTEQVSNDGKKLPGQLKDHLLNTFSVVTKNQPIYSLDKQYIKDVTALLTRLRNAHRRHAI